ncbi:MAG: CHAT domain-containing tetratricopeptide repeat protein [Bacteroidia bacterium]
MKPIFILTILFNILFNRGLGQNDSLTCETCKKILEQKLQFASSYNEALKIADKCTHICGKENAINDTAYIRSLNQIGEIYFTDSPHRKAIQYFNRVTAIREKVDSKESASYAQSLNAIGAFNFVIGKYKKSIKFYQQALGIREKVLGKEHTDCASTLNNIGVCYFAKFEYEKALSYFQQSLNIREKAFSKENADYAQSLNNIGAVYFGLGQFEKTLQYDLEAIAIKEKVLGKEHPDYATELHNISLVYHETSQFEKELDYNKQALAIQEKILGKDNWDYLQSLSSLGTNYYNTGQFEKSIWYEEQTFATLLNILQKEDSTHRNIFNQYVYYTGDEGDMDAAISNTLNYPNTFTRMNCIYTWYSQIRNNLGATYLKIRQYDNAYDHIYAAWYYEHKIGGVIKHGQSAYSFTNMRNGNTEYNFSLINKKKERVHRAMISHNFGEYQRICNLNPLFNRKETYENAIKNYERSLKLFKQSFGEWHQECAIQLIGIGHVYYNMNMFKEALIYYTKAHNIFEKGLNKGQPDDIWALIGIGKIYWQWNQSEKVLKNANEQFTSTKSYLLNNIFLLSENIKSNFRNYSNWYFSNAYLSRACNDSSFQWLYDNELFQRGLELESIYGLTASVQKDITLKALWDNYSFYKNVLGKEYLKPVSGRRKDLASIEDSVNGFESELLVKSAPYRNWKERVNVTWKDVQRHLSDDEASVEFVSFKYISHLKTDSTIYAALIITPNIKYPKLIFLFEEKQLAGLLQNVSTTSSSNISELYTVRGVKVVNSTSLQYGDSLFKLAWQPLLPYLLNIKTISFVPDGLLNKINMTAIPGNDGKPLCQSYHLKQMLSTRSVAFPEVEPAQQPAVLIGGIEYNYEFSNDTLPKFDSTSVSLVQLVSRSRGSEFGFLNGAKEEVENISNTYKTKNIPCQIVEGKRATEKSFKLMDGNSPALMHIATHGFFFPAAAKNENRAVVNESNYSLAEDPLLRSGLVFYGGNYAWKNGSNPYEEEDGILTAYEISHLNLSNTGLVVLSACETGLGDIKGSEGVYGFQRAFKMAGVKYLMMSLWQVPDKETQEFMESFYSKWLNGQKIRGAFQQTQFEMSQKYDPYKWAAFVLVE